MNSKLVLYRYKGNSCTYCGKSVDEILKAFQTAACFQFHHIDPSQKSPEYENLIRRKLSSEQLDEVDKCALLCGNCHSILHGQNRTIDANVTLNAEGVEPIQHSLKCQMICNATTQEATLFSDEFQYLDLYRVAIGDGIPQVYSGIQLRDLHMLDKLIEGTRFGPNVSIEMLDGTSMFSARKLNDEECEVFTNAEFPFFSAQLTFGTPDGGHTMNWFVRKGHVIVDNGKHYIMRSHSRRTITMQAVTKYRDTMD